MVTSHTFSLKSSVFNLLSPLLADEGIELVDVEYEEERGMKALRLLISKPGGVNTADCRDVSQLVGPILDVHGAIRGRYNLEVASPGIERPLVTEADFRRNLGRKVQIKVSSSKGKPLQLSGTLADVSEGKISLNQVSGKTIQILISEITKAQIQLMW